MPEVKKADVFQWLKDYWVFIATLATIVAYAENVRSKVSHIESNLSKQTAVVEKMLEQYDSDTKQWTEYMSGDVERWKAQVEQNKRFDERLKNLETLRR